MSTPRVLFLVVVALVTASSCSAAKVFSDPNSSMEPTILQGEKFAVVMQSFEPKRGDLVIFTHADQLVVKRVIGIAGDVVEGRDLKVFVNEKLQDEPYVEHTGKHPSSMKTLETFGPIKVPEGKLFVAGDNRDFSFDSRDPGFGLVNTSDIKGRPTVIVESPDPQRVHRELR